MVCLPDFLVGMLFFSDFVLSSQDSFRGFTDVPLLFLCGGSAEDGSILSVVSLILSLVCGVDGVAFLLHGVGDILIPSSPSFLAISDSTDCLDTTVPSPIV